MNNDIKFLTHYIKIDDELIPIGYTQLNARIVGMIKNDFKREYTHYGDIHTTYVEQIAKCAIPGDDDYVYLYKCFDTDSHDIFYFIVGDKQLYYTDDNKKTQYYEKIVYDEMMNFHIDTDYHALIKFGEYVEQNCF